MKTFIITYGFALDVPLEERQTVSKYYVCVHVHSNKWRWSSDEVSRQKQPKVL